GVELGIFAKATSRQSFFPAGISSTSKSPPPGRQGFAGSSCSSSTSICSSSPDFQSRSTRVEETSSDVSSSSTVPGVSSKLPKASGCALRSILIGAGLTGISSTGSSNAGGGGGGVCKASGLNSAGAGGGGGSAGAPTTTPARERADFTIEIKGSGGTKGFFRTPSAPTR